MVNKINFYDINHEILYRHVKDEYLYQLEKKKSLEERANFLLVFLGVIITFLISKDIKVIKLDIVNILGTKITLISILKLVPIISLIICIYSVLKCIELQDEMQEFGPTSVNMNFNRLEENYICEMEFLGKKIEVSKNLINDLNVRIFIADYLAVINSLKEINSKKTIHLKKATRYLKIVFCTIWILFLN